MDILTYIQMYLYPNVYILGFILWDDEYYLDSRLVRVPARYPVVR